MVVLALMEQPAKIYKFYFIALILILNINLCFANIFNLPNPFHKKPIANNYIDGRSYPNHWQFLRTNFSWHNDKNIDIQHPKVTKQLSRLMKYPNYMRDISGRAEPYLFYLSKEIHKRGLPAELALLPIIESAFNPFAHSNAGAAGIWQLMPRTAQHYGAKLNWWYDGRLDIVSSTKTALDYLEKLYKDFNNDWLLAIAAYNSGDGTVRKAIRYNTEHNKPIDFWSLKLPRETQKYIPKLLAFIEIINKPSKYNQKLPYIPHQPYFTIIDLNSQIDLSLAARLGNINIEQLSNLNPGYNRFATGPDGPYHLVLPIANSLIFHTNLSKLNPSTLVTYKKYKIQKGDSLIKIAKKFSTTTGVIKQLNNLPNNTIRANKSLIIPISNESLLA